MKNTKSTQGDYRSSASFGKRHEYIAIAKLLQHGYDVYMTLVSVRVIGRISPPLLIPSCSISHSVDAIRPLLRFLPLRQNQLSVSPSIKLSQ